MKYSLYLILVFYIFYSCDEKQNKYFKKVEISDFNITNEILGDTIPLEDYSFNVSIIAHDSLLILTKSAFKTNNGDPYINIYHKEKLHKLSSIGKKGEGAWHDEWIEIFHDKQIMKSNSELTLWVHNFNIGFIAQLNLTKSLYENSNKPIVDTTLIIDSKKFPFMSALVSENEIIANSWLNETPQILIKKFNLETKKTKKIESKPLISNSNVLPSEVINSLYSNSIMKNPVNNRIVQSMYVFNRLNIYDKELNLMYSVVDGENWQDYYYDAKKIDIQSDFFKGRVHGYSRICVSQQYIFAIVANPDYYINDMEEKYNSLIKVFDWDGNPAFLLYSKNKIFDISYEDKNSILYALDNENELVLKYDIKDIVEKWQNTIK